LISRIATEVTIDLTERRLPSRRVKHDFDHAILKQHDLRADIEGKDKPVIGTIFEVATADTISDHVVTFDATIQS